MLLAGIGLTACSQNRQHRSPDDLTSEPTPAVPDQGGGGNSGQACSSCGGHHGAPTNQGGGSSVTTSGGCEQVIATSNSIVDVHVQVPVANEFVIRTTTGQATVTTSVACDGTNRCNKPTCKKCRR